jgi:hypothetical protein
VALALALARRYRGCCRRPRRPGLEMLDLRRNNFFGPIPKSICKCTRLVRESVCKCTRLVRESVCK